MVDAATAVAVLDPNQITLAPVVAVFSPYFDMLVKGIITLAIGILSAKAYQWFGVRVSDTLQTQATVLASNVAGAIVAKGEESISSKIITVNSPELVSAVDHLEAVTPGVLKQLGVTPDGFRRSVAGELGKLQAVMSATAPAPATVVQLVPVSNSAGLRPGN